MTRYIINLHKVETRIKNYYQGITEDEESRQGCSEPVIQEIFENEADAREAFTQYHSDFREMQGVAGTYYIAEEYTLGKEVYELDEDGDMDIDYTEGLEISDI